MTRVESGIEAEAECRLSGKKQHMGQYKVSAESEKPKDVWGTGPPIKENSGREATPHIAGW